MAKAPGKSATPTKGKTLARTAAEKAATAVGRMPKSGQFVKAGLSTKGPAPGYGFLAKTKLKKAGGSLVMTVPASARHLLHLSEGQEMAVSVEGSKVVLEPIPTAKPMRVRRPKYTLDELLAGSNPDAPMTDEERAWHDAPPVGREIW